MEPGPERTAYVVQRWQAGMTQRQIAEEIGVTAPRVRAMLLKAALQAFTAEYGDIDNWPDEIKNRGSQGWAWALRRRGPHMCPTCKREWDHPAT